ncbi:MAG: hypothetical protein PHS80_01175 [Methanothrix sp.]|nr:hypothetical protein [Methanothrix sp.]
MYTCDYKFIIICHNSQKELAIIRTVNFIAGVCKAAQLSLTASAGQEMKTIGKSDREQILEKGMQTFFGEEHQDGSHGRSNHVAGKKG